MNQNYENLIDMISYQAKENPKKIALILEDKNICFKELDTIIWKVAMYLHKQKIPKNQILAHIFKNQFNLIITMLATAKIGLTVFSIPQNNSIKQKNDLMDKLNINYIVSDFDEDLGVTNILIDLENILKDIKRINYSIKDEKPLAPWLIIRGSGTTGNPKFLPIYHKNQIERSKINITEYFGNNENIKISSLIHFDYSGTKTRLFKSFYNGATYVLFENKNLLDIADICIKHEITILYSTVFHLENFLHFFKQMKIKKPFVKICRLSSSTISEKLRKESLDFICDNVFVQFSSNETGSLTGILQNKNTKIDSSVGKAHKGIQIQIVDEKDKEKAVGEIGHIRVKSPGMIEEYLNDEASTKRAFRNGWFYPGDLGKLTEDKEIIYCGRSDQMMIMNGINIYPAQIENIIISHEVVKDAAVMPIKHPVHQDIPICAVVLKENKQISKNELMEYCVERLGFASPKEIVFLDEIPRNEQGKVVREKLKQNVTNSLSIQDEFKSTKSLNIQLTLGEKKDLFCIKQWFEKVLNIDLSEVLNQNPVTAICKSALSLATVLFQASQIPIFRDSKLISINQNNEQKNKFDIVILFEYLDLIPDKYYLNIINFSFKYTLWMMNNELTLENKKLLFENILNETINPIVSTMPPGKSRIHILKEAFKKNIPYLHLGSGVYQLGWGSKSRKFDRSTVDTDSAMGSKLSQNKIFTANILKMSGLPAPIHGVTNKLEEAFSIAQQLKYPVVIKPIDLDRGEGVSVNISNNEQLSKAFEVAYNLSKSKQVIIEKQVSGVCHRLFIVNDSLLYAVKRLPISIQADGKNSIKELIEQANLRESYKTPWDYTKEFYPLDNLTLESIKDFGYNLDSIPTKNSWIPLRDIESTRWSGRDEDVTDIIHPENLKIAIQVTKIFELEVSGIDIITTDISKPWYETGAIINEVNFAPLLGGGEISRSNIGVFLDKILKGDGKIPIEIYKNNSFALNRQKEFISQNKRCYFVNNDIVLDDKMNKIVFPNLILSKKIKALLLNKNVDALVVVEK